jgi:ketosteroid isomerase-like protein
MLRSLALSRHGLRALLCCGVLLAGAGPAAAQDVSGSLARVAAAWQRGDAAAITALGANAGISLDVDGRTVGPLAARQAAAVLRRVFEDRESVGVRITMSRIVGGEPARAFGELAWTTRARGTTIPDSARLYIAFVHEDDRWRITEIRLLR